MSRRVDTGGSGRCEEGEEVHHPVESHGGGLFLCVMGKLFYFGMKDFLLGRGKFGKKTVIRMRIGL